MTFVNTRWRRRREGGDDPLMVDDFMVKVKKKNSKMFKNLDGNKQ